MGKEAIQSFIWGPAGWGVKKALTGGDTPSVSNTAALDVDAAKKKSKRSKSQLIMNEAGLPGQELTPNQVGGGSSNKILGN